ncbi:hypothetical protein BX070DRAFT_229414 [Coemansia spiralis]|nr:hypothetical protein BX070DRAFT_229414 [Coemansia spiralis]
MIFKSAAPAVEIPGLDIPSFYIGASKLNSPSPDTLAYYDIETGESLTFKQLEAMYQQIGSGLVNKLSAQPGDVAAIFASNTVYFAPVLLGTISLGAVCCTVSSGFTESELEYQLSDCNARFLFVGVKQVPVVCSALSKGLLKIASSNIIVLKNNSTGNAKSSQVGFQTLNQLFCDKEFEQKRIVNDKEAASKMLAVIVYSSGTTGLPKGVMLSHQNFIAYTMQSATMFEYLGGKYCEELGIEPPEAPQRQIAILPFAHIYGLTSLVTNSIAGGKTQYILNEFSIERFLQALQDYKIQSATAVPSVLSQILNYKNIAKYDLSSLRVLSSGGAPLPSGVHTNIKSRFPVNTGNGYGMSETCSGVCLMGNYMFQPGSVGFIYSATEAKFVDPATGKALGVGEEGEFCVRSPSIMLGYLNRPKETAQTIDGDRFLHTGDIGYINKTGHIFITDRMKELIKYKGLQIPPAELESILMDHPLIADAAVIGIEDKQRNTEVPKAYIVSKSPATAADASAARRLCADAASWVAGKVAKHKRLRGGVELTDHIPRNQSGKILRRELRAKHNAKHSAKF